MDEKEDGASLVHAYDITTVVNEGGLVEGGERVTRQLLGITR